MQVIKKTNSGIQNLSLDAVLLDRRKVFLSGGIDSESVDLVVKQLLFLESMDDREPIQLIINSCRSIYTARRWPLRWRQSFLLRGKKDIALS